MATSRRSYVITYHLRERFVERTNKKYRHARDCRDRMCQQCCSLKQQIKMDALSSKEEIDADIYNSLDNADEDRSYLNNSGFMEWYYNKYGYDKRFEFLVYDDILFVIVHDAGKKVGVTCVLAKTHLAGKTIIYKSKFNRVKKKEEKLLESDC